MNKMIEGMKQTENPLKEMFGRLKGKTIKSAQESKDEIRADELVKEQLHELLFSRKAISIDEAIKKAKKRWQE